MSFQQPILLYSKYCEYSNNFILALRKNVDLYTSFALINIDADPQTKKRPRVLYEIQKQLGMPIKEVPTIIVEKGEYMLSGSEAFKWLDFQLQEFEKKDLQPYSCLEMGSFSDQYSQYGSSDSNNATDQTYLFINKKYDQIVTPKEDSASVKEIDYEKKQMERESFGTVPKQNSIDNKIKFSMNTFESSNNSNRNINSFETTSNSNANNKQKELDLRYKQLLNERDSILPKAPKPNPNNIDFQSGKIY